MRRIALLTIFLVFLGCDEEANEIKIKDQQSMVLERPTLPGQNDGTVYLQVQDLQVGFNENISVAYTAANVSSIKLYLERKRIRNYPFSVSQYFDNVNNIDKRFLQTVSFPHDVNSGTLSIAVPANVYYDNNYQIKAYNSSETEVLATSNEFTVGTHELSVFPTKSSKKYYENSPGGLITYNSNMDPYTLMIIEINRPGEKIKRFVTNAISSNYQVYEFNHRTLWSSYSLIGKLSDLNPSDINNVLYQPTQNIFSHDDYIVKIYPYGYNGISTSISGVEFIENKTEWNTPQTPYLVKKTYRSSTNTLKLEPYGFPYSQLRYDLYLNGKFVKVLSGPTSNPYILQLAALNLINPSPYAIWRVRATWIGSNGYMGETSSLVYINPSWL